MVNHIDVWQGSDYSAGSAYTRIFNMPVLQKVLKKMMHHGCLAGFQTCSEHATVLIIPGLHKVVSRSNAPL